MNDRSADPDEAGISERTFRISAAAILVIGAFLRLYSLSLVPLHHDEGVNGNFLVSLVRSGTYTYDPNNYHGPTLYYFAAIFGWVTRFFGGKDFSDAYGLTTFNIRFVTAAFGIATIGLALLLRKRLGAIGALSAAALIAISPGGVYLSRYFIHESLFVFFTLGIVVAVVKYYDTAAGVYLILAAISAAMMTATKETWIINGPVLLIALGTTTAYCLVRWALKQDAVNPKSLENGRNPFIAALGYPIGIIAVVNLLSSTRNTRFHALQSIIINGTFVPLEILFDLTGVRWAFLLVVALHVAIVLILAIKVYSGATGILPVIGTIAERYSGGDLLDRFGGPVSVATVGLIAFTIFIVVNVIFYSSFFSNYPKGVNDALQTLALWRKRTHEHAHPWYQYIRWLLQEEGIVLVLGGLGALIAFWRAENRMVVFLAFWSLGILAAYSIAGMSVSRLLSDLFSHPLSLQATYKTPWIALNFIVPFALTSGYALDVFYRKLREYDQRLFFLAPAVLIAAYCGYQMFQLNFVHYDDDQYVYVYAHTRREMLSMLDQIDRVAKHMNTGKDTGIAIVSPEYWPLPWYFRDYKRVGYYQKVVPTTEPIIIGSASEIEEIEAMYGSQYELIDSSKLSDPRILPDRNPAGSFSLRPGVELLLYVRRDVAK